MYQVISRFFTQADVKSLQQALLHSTCWSQGQRHVYGQTQQKQLWAKWLAHVGLVKQAEPVVIDTGAQQRFVLYQLSNGERSLSVGAWLYHNHSHIKSLEIVLDTEELAEFSNQNLEQLKDWWPSPDPLVLSDFDQQCHPHTRHAVPADLLTIKGQPVAQLEQWWSIWQRFNLAAVSHLYAADCDWQYPSQQVRKPADLITLVAMMNTRLTRSYAQLEKILIDASTQKKVAIGWRIEGDMLDNNGNPIRVRLPITSYLELSSQGITKERLLFDEAAFQKAFAVASVFSGNGKV
ncbi:nuclear transport factor 2 family protein [Lacimicrobium alkaliphilum]|nr:nuclear transport factor 2 family protein [Lacimicrobium alkaliphilum]